MATLMFYTDKAGLKEGGVRKLRKAGIIAVKVDDPKEIHWPNPADVDFGTVQDSLSVIMLKAISNMAGQSSNMEIFLGRHLLTAMNAAAAKKTAAPNVAPIKATR